MRAPRLLGCFILAAVCSGCAAFQTGRFSPGERAGKFGLSDEEVAFVRALAHYARGLILEDEEGIDSEEALMHFDDAAALDPEQPNLYAKTAAIHLRRNELQEAVNDLEESCRHNPRDLQVRVDLAAVYEAGGELDKAAHHYRKAIKLNSELPLLYAELANVYFVKREDKRAVKILLKGLRKVENPNSILVSCYNTGVKFISANQVERAILCFQLIAEHHPSEVYKFYQLLGELHETAGNEKEAVENFTLATKSEPATPMPFLKLAALYVRKDWNKALESLNNAAIIFPDDPSVFFSIGILYTSKEKFEKAVEAFEQARQTADRSGSSDSLNANFYLHYGAACEQAGEYDKAEEIFQHCIEIYPDSHEVLNYLAYMWAVQGRMLDQALAYVKKALELDPENGAYIDTLGWIYYKQEKYDQALEEVEKANALIKDDATVTDHLGDILSAMNENEKAVTYWQQSYMLDSGNEEVARKLREYGIDPEQLRKKTEAGKEPEPETEKSEDNN